jgi:hypothetical protein
MQGRTVRERDTERVLNDLGGAVTVLAVDFFFEKLAICTRRQLAPRAAPL